MRTLKPAVRKARMDALVLAALFFVMLGGITVFDFASASSDDKKEPPKVTEPAKAASIPFDEVGRLKMKIHSQKLQILNDHQAVVKRAEADLSDEVAAFNAEWAEMAKEFSAKYRVKVDEEYVPDVNGENLILKTPPPKDEPKK